MTNAEQNRPVLAGSDDGSIDEKLRGILLQVAADHESRPDEDLEAVLARRLQDAGLHFTEDAVAGLARRVPGLTRKEGTDLQPGAH